MPLQRARVSWNSGKKQFVKWTAEGAVKCADYGTEYSATCRHALVVGGMSVSFKAYTFCVNQGGTADNKFIRP